MNIFFILMILDVKQYHFDSLNPFKFNQKSQTSNQMLIFMTRLTNRRH